MTIAEIREIFAAEGSDKTTAHRYEHVYSLIHPRVPRGAIMEIGYQAGGGMAGLGRLFPDRRRVAIDLGFDGDLRPDAAIERICCNTMDIQALVRLSEQLDRSSFALIVDDGSHRFGDQLNCIAAFWRLLVPGGIYLIEDVSSLEHAYRFQTFPGFVAIDTRPLGQGDDICVLLQA